MPEVAYLCLNISGEIPDWKFLYIKVDFGKPTQ